MQARTWPPCSAAPRATADGYVLNGRKTWISNGGIADFYVVFARTGEGLGGTPAGVPKGITAFIVDADTARSVDRRAHRRGGPSPAGHAQV